MVENLPDNAGDTGDMSSIPEAGRSPGGGNGNPLQYSCLENPMDREAWQATVRLPLWGSKELDMPEQLHSLTHTRQAENSELEFNPGLKVKRYASRKITK